MSASKIAPIGGKKKIRDKWYQKAKATWTARGLPEMSIRTTKRQIRDRLELAIMEINALGTENAKLKNAIARMKRSAR